MLNLYLFSVPIKHPHYYNIIIGAAWNILIPEVNKHSMISWYFAFRVCAKLLTSDRMKSFKQKTYSMRSKKNK